MCAARNFSSRLLPDENEVLKAFKHKAKQKKNKRFSENAGSRREKFEKRKLFEVIWKLFKVVFCFLYIEFPCLLGCLLHYVPFGLKASPSVACFPFKQQEKEKMYGCERMSTDSDIGIFNQ